MNAKGVAASLELRVLGEGERGVVEDGAGFGTGDEKTGGGVAAVRKAFAPDDKALAAEDGQHDGTGQANEDGVASGEMDATGNGGGDFAIDSGFVVEGAVGFDVTEFEAGFAGGVASEGNLGGDKVGDGGGVELLAEEGAAAEVCGVGITGVSAGPDARGGDFAEGGAGQFRRAGVSGAADIGEVEVAEEGALFAGGEEGRGFAEVAIQEHGHPR